MIESGFYFERKPDRKTDAKLINLLEKHIGDIPKRNG